MHKLVLGMSVVINPRMVTAWIVLCALFLLVVTLRYKYFFEKGIHTKAKPFKKRVSNKRTKK